MYELLLKDEVVDRAPLANLEQAKTFFMKRKQMTEEQFNELGYSVRLDKPKKRKIIGAVTQLGECFPCTEEVVGSNPISSTIQM